MEILAAILVCHCNCDIHPYQTSAAVWLIWGFYSSILMCRRIPIEFCKNTDSISLGVGGVVRVGDGQLGEVLRF